MFEENSDLIFLGKNFKDIEKANTEKKTAIFFGFQNCSPIEDDIKKIVSELNDYMEVGVTHFLPEPRQRRIEKYLQSVQILADIFHESGIHMSDR